MTLPLNSRLSALYDTNGTQKDFSFGFRVFFDPDNGGYGLEVRRQTVDGYEVIPKSDYLVLPVEDNSAGVVRFSVAPSAGQQIYIAGKTPTIQQLVLTNFGRYSAESIETQFDFITAIIQEWLSALGEETRQRIAADNILTQYVVQRIDDFVQQVNQNWDDKSQEIEDYINTIMPSFTQTLRDEIEAFAVAGMQDAIDQTLADSKAEIDDAVARANAAALAAAITGKVYDTPEAGVNPVTGVADGAYFNVRSSSDDSYVDEYQNIGGVPTPSGKSYPSSAAVQALNNELEDLSRNTAYFYPTVTAMLADQSLTDGVVVGTKGYHNIFDDGGSVYLISAAATDYSIPLANGLHAVFRDSFDIRKFGIQDNETLDQTTELQRMIAYADTRFYEIDFLNFSLQVPKIWTELATWHMENGSPVDTTLFMAMTFTQAHKLKNLKISHDKTVRLENAQCMIIFAPLVNPSFEQWFVLENIEFDAWNPNYSPVTDNYMGNGDGGRHGFFACPKVGSSIPTHTPDIINYSYEFKNIHFKSPAYSYNLCPFITAKNVKFENLTGDYLALYLLQQADTFVGKNLNAVYRDDLREANRLIVTNAIHYEAEFTGKTVTHQLTDIKNISSVKKSTGEPYSAYVFHSLSDKITMNKFVLDNITGHCRLFNVNIIDAEYKNSRIGASFIVLNCPTVARLVIDNWVSNDNQGSYGSAPFLLRTPNIDYLEISNSELQYTLYVSGETASVTVNKLVLNNIYINEVESFKSGIAFGANCNIKQLIANGLRLADGWQRIYTANVEYARLSDVNFGNGELPTIINNPSDKVSNVEILNSSSTRTNSAYDNAVKGKINLKIINSSFADLIKVGSEVNIKYINSVAQITQTYDFPSLATATQQKNTFWWAGVKLGTNLEVYFDKSLQGTRIWAEVESDNYVTVYHRNDTGATVDLPSGTLTFRLI